MRIVVLSFVTLLLAASACSSDPGPAFTRSDGGVATDGGSQPAVDGSGQPPPPSEKVRLTNERIDVDGTDREYVLVVPAKLEAGRSYPLVLVFHGDGGSGPSMRAGHTFDATSLDQAVVAYPTGINAGWNIDSPNDENADIHFVEKLVETLTAKYSVDTSRVFGVGYSAGGFFINKVACRKTGFFRAIVSHGGGAPNETEDPRAGYWPNGYTKCADQTGGVAALVVHGEDDGTVTPDSGNFTAMYWASLNNCNDSRSATTPSPCVKYDGCDEGMPVTYCLIPGLGHVVWDQGVSTAWSFMKSF